MSINANNVALNKILETINELPEAGGGKEEQEKSIDITENGETIVTPDDENTTLSKVIVNVEVPTKEEQEKVVDITENGTTEITPDEGMVLSKVTVNTAISSGGGGTEEIITITTATTNTQEAYNIFSAFKNDNEQVVLFVNTKTIDNMSINNLGMFAVLSLTPTSVSFGRYRDGKTSFTSTVGANYDFVLPVGETFKKVVLF